MLPSTKCGNKNSLRQCRRAASSRQPFLRSSAETFLLLRCCHLLPQVPIRFIKNAFLCGAVIGLLYMQIVLNRILLSRVECEKFRSSKMHACSELNYGVTRDFLFACMLLLNTIRIFVASCAMPQNSPRDKGCNSQIAAQMCP